MIYIKSFNEDLNINDALEYLKLCFIDMSDEYGIYVENDLGEDNDGISISYIDDNDQFMITTPMVWVKGVTGGLKKAKFGFESIESLVNYGELFLKFSKCIEEGLSKFSSRYNFEHSMTLTDFINVYIYNVEEK